MEDIKDRNNRLRKIVADTSQRLHISELEDEIKVLQAESKATEFWKTAYSLGMK
jgi:hypothetical protein